VLACTNHAVLKIGRTIQNSLSLRQDIALLRRSSFADSTHPQPCSAPVVVACAGEAGLPSELTTDSGGAGRQRTCVCLCMARLATLLRRLS
jgi:hypothetical protein